MERAQCLELRTGAMQGQVFADQRDDVDRVLDGGKCRFGVSGHRGLLNRSLRPGSMVIAVAGTRTPSRSLSRGRTPCPFCAGFIENYNPWSKNGQVFLILARRRDGLPKVSRLFHLERALVGQSGPLYPIVMSGMANLLTTVIAMFLLRQSLPSPYLVPHNQPETRVRRRELSRKPGVQVKTAPVRRRRSGAVVLSPGLAGLSRRPQTSRCVDVGGSG